MMINHIKACTAVSIIFAVCNTGLVYAADGTIHFTGAITDSPCIVDPESTNQTVNLGTVASTAFAGAGSTASPTWFSIKLTQCPSTVSSATVRFDGTTAAANSNVIALNEESGAATNLGVAIYEADSTTLIPVGTPSAGVTLSSTEDNELTYLAKYYATGDNVTAGPANATATFTINYN